MLQVKSERIDPNNILLEEFINWVCNCHKLAYMPMVAFVLCNTLFRVNVGFPGCKPTSKITEYNVKERKDISQD